jgi:predicted nucleotidyltransferase
MEKEIARSTGVSRSGANVALKYLLKENLVRSARKGRMSFYYVDIDDPLIKQLKIVTSLLVIQPLVKKLQKKSQKIVLFGSVAQGTNIEESDIDLFVLTNTPKETLELANKSKLTEKVQLVAKKPVDLAALKKNDPVFYEEVERGIVLWEAR